MHNASIVDNGSLNFSDLQGGSSTARKFREKYILPYLKIQNYAYKPVQEHGYKNGILYPNGSEAYAKTASAHVFMLTNGMAIIYQTRGAYVGGVFMPDEAVYLVDVDGPYKGANTVGKDIFCFIQFFFKGIPLVAYGEYDIFIGTYNNSYDINSDPSGLKSKHGLLLNYETGSYIFTGKRFTREEIMTNCKAGDLKSMTCGALIKMNSWKIPDDYPW